ncbi:hypothetical protein ACFE04_006701 [Oxalis oulophora]
MDTCPFVRLTIGNLALKLPVSSKPASSVVHPSSSSPCYCKIKLKYFLPQTSSVSSDGVVSQTLAATFHLSKSDLDRLSNKSVFKAKACIKISIYTGRRGATCGVNSGKLLGKVSVPVDFNGTELKPVVFHNGWISIGSSSFHLNVKAEPDPRFVFQFDNEPECSPQVFQIHGNIRQPVFTCKFTFRNNNIDRNHRSRSLPSETSGGRKWLSSFGSERERPGKERKGWSITVHDLSGSPVALASMVTPFVASPGSDRVSRSNPGAWLILRPGDGTWKPWGRLEAWRERGSSDGLGYRFELIPDNTNGSGIVLAESTMSCSKGGNFVVDLGAGAGTNNLSRGTSPAVSPRSSGDFGYGLWPYCMYKGFVMSASVEGEGKCSKPSVQVSVQHVNCTEDAAAYVALAAAIDLSMDACKHFNQRLRKELCQQQY